VWVSNELWKAIRRQLESKVQEMNALVDEHQRVKQHLTETLNKAQVREYEMEGIVRDMENVREPLIISCSPLCTTDSERLPSVLRISIRVIYI
jgi:sensor domain CHASE-containing protein